MNATNKPSAVIAYDMQTAQHAQASVAMDYDLLADAKRLGIASKEFANSCRIGFMAGIAKKTLEWAAEVLAKPNPDSKAKGAKRTKAEQQVYLAANTRLSRFLKTHAVKPANKQRGKPGTKTEAEKKDVTPKAVSAKQADAYIRIQAAALKGYCERNKAVLPDALRFAVMEFAEAVDAVPVALSDDETK